MKTNKKRKRKYNPNKLLYTPTATEILKPVIKNEYSLFNSKLVLFWGGMVLFLTIECRGFSIKTISTFLIILVILFVVYGFGSRIIIEEDKIIRKGIWCLSFRGKRILYFNEICDASAKFKIMPSRPTACSIPIYILKDKRNRKLCIIDGFFLPLELIVDLNNVFKAMLSYTNNVTKDDKIIEFLESGLMLNAEKKFEKHPTFIEAISSILALLFKGASILLFGYFILVYVLK